MLKTLIVEDNAAYRQSLHRLLSSRFQTMEITEATDGDEALAYVRSQRFDLVFLDIRMPHGNGLDLTTIIKTLYTDSMICVITNYDILEYQKAAYRNGADRFMVKGESTEAMILDMVESLLRTRFITLLAINDPLPRKQLNMLLSIHWPIMIMKEVLDAAMTLAHAAELKPNLILLDLELPGAGVAELIREIRAMSPKTTFIGMTAEESRACRVTADDYGLDHCVASAPMGHTELVAIVKAMQSDRTLH